MANVDSGACVEVDGLPRQTYGQVTCSASGRAQVGLYADDACSITYMTGSGVGNGVACIALDGAYNAAVKINCAAPGYVPGSSSSSLSPGAIAGIVIAIIVVLSAIAGLAIYFSGRKAAVTLGQNTMHMQQQQPPQAMQQYAPQAAVYMQHSHPIGPHHPVYATGQQAPPAVMAIALLTCICVIIV
jgi:hypothetical protein